MSTIPPKQSIKAKYDNCLGLLKVCKDPTVLTYVFEHFTHFQTTPTGYLVNYGGYNIRINETLVGYSIGLYSGLGNTAIQYDEVEW